LSSAVVNGLCAPLPELPRPRVPEADELTWDFLKDSRDPTALQQFVQRFPTSAFRREAEARLTALAAEVEEARRKAPPPAPPPDEISWTFLKASKDADQLRRFIEQFPSSPRRNEAEARVAALAVEAEEARRKAPAPAPPPDEVSWTFLKASKDADQLRRFIEQFPDSARRNEAEQRVAALAAEAEEAKRTSSAAPTVDRREFARALQLELKRVGCFDGTVDGEFGNATRAALRNFAKFAAISLPDQDASADAIQAVRGFDKRICPLVCPSGERAEGERCIRIVCGGGQVLRNGACISIEPKRPASARREAAPRPSGGGKCFTFQGRQFCE